MGSHWAADNNCRRLHYFTLPDVGEDDAQVAAGIEGLEAARGGLTVDTAIRIEEEGNDRIF